MSTPTITAGPRSRKPQAILVTSSMMPVVTRPPARYASPFRSLFLSLSSPSDIVMNVAELAARPTHAEMMVHWDTF
ncbi:hypothetical protein CVT25_009315, partial [Psilocybe cyanescens]